jgi:hypothetical protein
VRRSVNMGFADSLARVFGFVPLRCRTCRYHFHGWTAAYGVAPRFPRAERFSLLIEPFLQPSSALVLIGAVGIHTKGVYIADA